MPKEEVQEVTMEDIFEQLFYETEEQRQERLQEKYQINDPGDIDKLLASSLSYKDKLILLHKEQSRVTSLSEEMQEAEYKFKNTRYFIDKMLEACQEIKNDLKFDIPVSIGGITISAGTFYQLSKFLEAHRFTQLSLDQFGGLLFGGVFAPLVGLIYTYYTVKEVSTLRDYKKQINSYNRKLKRRRQ